MGFVADCTFQCFHQIDDVLAFWSGFRTNRLAVTLGIDQFGQRGLVVILELLGFELASLLGDDMLRQVEHVLGDLHVLDVVKVFLLVPDFVGIAQ